MNQVEYFKFLNLNLLEYHKTDILGSDNFLMPLKNLNDNIKKLLDESIEIMTTKDAKIPSILIEIVDSNINRVNSFITSIDDIASRWGINADINQRRTLDDQRREIIAQINNFIQEVYYQRTDQGKGQNNNLLSIISLIKTYDNRAQFILSEYDAKKNLLDNKVSELDTRSSLYENKVREAEKILDELRTEASKKVVYEYANIFLDESKRNSNYDSDKKWFRKFGSAERWLFIGILSIVILILFAIFMNQLFPIKTNGEYDIPNIMSKLSLLGIIIFIIRFAFKQYSVNKHLFTLNKHRENVLNSYQLFLKTVGDDDANIRNVLMLEVAKAIYEQGKTGFITDKEGDSSSPSIIEFTKLLTKDKI